MLWAITYGYCCPLVVFWLGQRSTCSEIFYFLPLCSSFLELLTYVWPYSLFNNYNLKLQLSHGGVNHWRMESDASEARGHLWFCLPRNSHSPTQTQFEIFTRLWIPFQDAYRVEILLSPLFFNYIYKKKKKKRYYYRSQDFVYIK